MIEDPDLEYEEDFPDEDLASEVAIDDADFDQGSGDKLYEHYRVVADAGQSLIRIDKYLVDRMTHTTRNRIQQAAEAGFIFVNDKPVKSNYRVKPRDVITLQLRRPKHELKIIPEDIPLNIIYEDHDLMVINKPAGLVVHPGHGNYTGTLVNALAFYLKDDPQYDPDDARVGLVHRIDKDTSGLLVVAKNPETKADLSRQFFYKTTHRSYRALVWGRFDENEGTVEGNIGRDPKDRLLMTVFPPLSPMGKPAVTHYRVLEELAFVSWIECRLETGRTHQIRAHMKYIGHVLFGDQRYGGDKILRGNTFVKYQQFVRNCLEICSRQALHAKTLGFKHPKTGEELMFDSELPEDLTILLDKWRAYATQLDNE